MKQEVDEPRARDRRRCAPRPTELTADVDRLRTDPDYIEQIAREELGLVKPGETRAQAAAGPGSR